MTLPGGFGRGDASEAEKLALFEALCVVLGAMHKAGMVGDAIRLTDQPPEPFGKGATGKYVKIWQIVVGATPDAIFGPKTEALTLVWSEKAGFGRRTHVEPAMWSLAVGVTLGLGDLEVMLPSGETIDLPLAASGVAAALGVQG